MKKQVLGAALGVALIASTSFGAALSSNIRPFAAFGTNGASAGITTKMYDAALTVSNTSDDASRKTEQTNIGVAASYKWAVDNTSSIKTGARFASVSGKSNGITLDSSTTIAATVGLETEVSNNVLVNAGVDLFSTNATKVSGVTVNTTGILNNGSVSVSWLF